MIGKGAFYKSLKDIEPGMHVWMNHVKGMDITQVVVKVIGKRKGSVIVQMDSGSTIECTNPKAFMKVIGDL